MKPVLPQILCLFLLGACATPAHLPNEISSTTLEGVQALTGIAIPSTSKINSPNEVILVPGISLERPLSSDDAAAIALWNNAQFNADLASLGLSRGDLIDAGQLRNPRIDVLFPLGLKPFELLLNLPFEALWERPARVAAAQQAYEQLSQSLVQNAVNTVLEARLAHANFVLAKKRVEILANLSQVRFKMTKINTQQRLKTGELTAAEGILTEVDFETADELWIRAKHDTLLALERFRLALGLVFHTKPLEVTALSIPNSKEQASVDSLVETALTKRPDLKAAEINILAATKRAEWETSRIAQLSLLLNSKGIGTSGILTGPGISAEIPIFHQNNGRVERAEAEILLAVRQFWALKQRIAFEVREARELTVQAQEAALKLRHQVLPLLEKMVRIAESDYQRKSASAFFVLEQSRILNDARLRTIEAEASWVRAAIQLNRAIGGGL